MNLGKVLKSTGKSILGFANKNSHILSGCAAIAGVAVTAILAYKSYPKVNRIIEDQKEKMEELDEVVNIPEEELKRCRREITVDTCKSLAPVLAPAIVSGIATCGLMGFSIISGNKKIAAATSLAALYETANREILNKTKELVGEEKAEEIKKEVAQDKVNAMSHDGEFDIDAYGFYITGLGDHPWYDHLSGMLFRCSESAIRNAVLVCNEKMHNNLEGYISVNEFYDQLHLPRPGFGDLLGWGGNTYASKLDPNLYNSVTWGEGSVRVLDWIVPPAVDYKEQSRRR